MLKGRMSVAGIAELMEKRREAYESAADYRVKTDGRSPEEIAGEIAERLRKAAEFGAAAK